MDAFETFKFKLQSLAFGFSGCSIGSKASYDCGVLRGCPMSKVKGKTFRCTLGLPTEVSRVNVKMGDHEAAVQVPCCIFTLHLHVASWKTEVIQLLRCEYMPVKHVFCVDVSKKPVRQYERPSGW